MSDRRRPHLWTNEERIVLRLLNEQFPEKTEAAGRVAVFNRVFTTQHHAAGFPGGRDHASLRSAWSDKSRRMNSWVEVLNGPTPGQKAKWEALRGRIQQALKGLGRQTDANATPPIVASQSLSSAPSRARQAGPSEVDPPDALNGDEICDGCTENITREGRDSWMCAFCDEKDFCNTCYLNPTVKKCHAKALIHKPYAERQSSATSTLAPPIQGKGSAQDGMAMNIDPALLSAIHTTRPLHQRQSLEQPSALDPNYNETPLEMVHYGQVVWGGQQAYWHPGENGQITVSQDSPVYRAGGKVHRIIIGDKATVKNTMDMMICNPSTCPTCSDEIIDPSTITSNDATPLVHTADTMVHPAGLVFDPIQSPKYYDRHSTVFGAATLKNVVFADGKIRISEVCIVKRCFCYNDALLRGNWEDQLQG